jgi:hypothetical protein
MRIPPDRRGAHYAAPDADDAIADAAEVAGFVDAVWGGLRG